MLKKLLAAVVAAALTPIGGIIVYASDETALDETAEYLSAGVTATDDLYLYTASDGTEVGIYWDKVYDNTVTDEKGSYQNYEFLTHDGTLTRPEWYEGTKKLTATAVLTAGDEVQTVENIGITLPPKDAPEITADCLTDYIDIGNTASEAVTTADGTVINRFESVRDNGIETMTVDGTEHTYRTLNKSGAMVVNLKCDPEKTNYLTVKLWGSDAGAGMLWVCDPETGYMNPDNSRQPTRTSLIDRRDWVELNFLNSSPQYKGGFIYATYMIPTVYTEGRDYVSLRIYSTGANSDYASVTIKEQTEPSRSIYAAYMTQSASFDPTDFEEVTGALEETTVEDALSLDAQKFLAEDYAYDALQTFMSWQIYGADNYPSYMEGMVTRSTAWQTKSYDNTDWKDAYYNTSGILKQNLTPMNMYELYAYMYQNADAFDEEHLIDKAELMDRLVAGIDFLVRAQGANGGFNSSDGWIGGPDRADASGSNLTGFGLRSVAKSITMMYDDIAAAGYFDENIDSDADGVTDTNRRDAWEQMMAAARDYLVTLDGAGHAPNQDMADIIAALRFEQGLQIMQSTLSWKAQGNEEEIENELDIALGFDISKACSSYWVSPKGVILENFGSIHGGYSGDYGIAALEEMSQLAEFAEEYYGAQSEQAAKYNARLIAAYESADNFMFTADADTTGTPTLYSEGLISNRNAYYPGTERYVLDTYAAVDCANSTALKSYDWFFKHNKLERDSEIYTPSNAHFEDNALDAAELFVHFDEITAAMDAANIDSYNYVMEDDSVTSYAWADEMSRTVVIKNGEDKIYIALNWRNPVHTGTYYNTETVQNQQKSIMNNLARVHHKTDSYDKYGYAELATKGWSSGTSATAMWQTFSKHYVNAFMYMNYGDYTILMNSNNLLDEGSDISYAIPVSELGLYGIYRDLISGEYYSFGKQYDGVIYGDEAEVASATTLVLYKVNEAAVDTITYDGSEVNISFAAGDAPTGENSVIYTAEYTEDGTLYQAQAQTEYIDTDKDITFTWQKSDAQNHIKIFIWNDNMNPIENGYFEE